MKTITIDYVDAYQLIIDLNPYDFNEKEVLVQIFTSEFNKDFILKLQKTIVSIIPHCKLLGATTGGEITTSGVRENSTVISISSFENTKIEMIGHEYSTDVCIDCFNFGKKLSQQISNDPKLIISFADGLYINAEEYLKGINSIHKNTIIAGGLAAGEGDFTETYVFDNNNIYLKGAVLVALYNKDLYVNLEAKFNWRTIGQSMVITKSNGNIVHTINNQPTQEIYEKYLGKIIAEKLPRVGIEFPLIIDNEVTTTRGVINKFENGALEFGGNMPQGALVKFGYGDIADLLQSIVDFYNHFLNKPAEAFFVYSCSARRRFIPNFIFKEIEPFACNKETSGFFTHGEFFVKNNKVNFLNQSMTVLAISENENAHVTACNSPSLDDELVPFLNKYALTSLIQQTTLDLERSHQKVNELNTNLYMLVEEKIKELKEKESILLHQSKLASMGEMIANIAHQWRQPLNVIGALNMKMELQYQYEGNLLYDEYKQASNEINEQLEYMSKTIDDFRYFFKSNHKNEDFDLLLLMDDIYNFFERGFYSKNIKFNITGESIFISGNRNQFSQVLINLINNAKDAILENNVTYGMIDISLEKDNKNVFLKIFDNAGGIPVSIIDKVFDPYFTTKLESHGTGIGLYMSHKIISEYFSGSINVENISKVINNESYTGANFVISFPIENLIKECI